MMLKRPKINLSVAPSYDEVTDKRALQSEKLVLLVVKHSGIKNEKEHESAMTIDMLEDIYEDVKDDDILDKLQEKLKKEYKREMFDRAYLQALVELCKDIQIVTKLDLENLANTRANNIVTYLIEVQEVSTTRVTVTPIVIANEVDDKLVKQELKVEVK
jgi:hypothetical protein